MKPEILGHVVQSFSKQYMSVHHDHRLLYERDEVMYENNFPSTEKNTGNASKRLKSLKWKNLKKKCKLHCINVKVVRQIGLRHTFVWPFFLDASTSSARIL